MTLFDVYPNGATKIPPAYVPIILGIVFIAYPFIEWWRGKGSQMSDGIIAANFFFGALLVFYGIVIWFQWVHA